MGTFLYEALDKGGKQIKGVIEAANDKTIIDRLNGMGYYTLRVIPYKKRVEQLDILSLPVLRNIFHRVKFRHIVTFSRQLATLLDAGLPIIRSLFIIQQETESVIFRQKIDEMIDSIESGGSLSEAMAEHPKIFDLLYVNMVRAGEIGGVLEEILLKIANYMEKRQILNSKVRSAMLYPLVVVILATSIVSFILIKVIPRFIDIFKQLNAELPPPTMILVQVSNIMVHHGLWVLIGLILLGILYSRLNKTRAGKYMFDSMKLKIPAVGQLFRKIAIARFADTLSTLITAGVPILQALDIVRDTSGNEVIARAVEKVSDSVKDGESIHIPLAEAKVFPPMVVHMVAIGEETGAIDHMLIKVSEAYEREVDETVGALTTIIEPLLIVFFGVIIGLIVIALYLPYFYLPRYIGRE